jgi:hypothetical protein
VRGRILLGEFEMPESFDTIPKIVTPNGVLIERIIDAAIQEVDASA